MPSNWWSRCQDLLSFPWVSGGSINHFMALYRGSGSISDVWGLAAFRPPSYFSFCSTTDHPKKAWTLSLLVPTTSSIRVSTQTPPRSIFPIIRPLLYPHTLLVPCVDHMAALFSSWSCVWSPVSCLNSFGWENDPICLDPISALWCRTFTDDFTVSIQCHCPICHVWTLP